ncbi:hypothetical protein BV25DRAFT_765072 [Artomyces pyxidatus]|uniref:Uncharacterized protein n=1 Tax=Artomyces pyxidatus TaxID=48021 RepID=A0ACB8SYN2_9AGAM|nr:hypothetical protein BV25DRAFT_765072 [Artomyces pyxidatus]
MGLDFPSLPADVSVMLLETLPGRDILACGATCRRLRSLVTDSVSLQYAIELFACGMLDGPRGPQSLSIPDRLDRLRRFTAAWEQLQWTNRVMLSHFVGFRPCYDLSGDMLALTRADGLDLMVSRQFSSELRGIDEHHIVFAVPGSSRLSNFQVSLDQDLLFFKELLPGNSLRLHSRSLLTGETHPLAYISDVTNAAAYIHDICGDFLLETSYLDGPALSQLRLRNLKTGLVSKNGMPQDHKRAIFLDKHHILSVGPHIWGLANLSCLVLLPAPKPTRCRPRVAASTPILPTV